MAEVVMGGDWAVVEPWGVSGGAAKAAVRVAEAMAAVAREVAMVEGTVAARAVADMEVSGAAEAGVVEMVEAGTAAGSEAVVKVVARAEAVMEVVATAEASRAEGAMGVAVLEAVVTAAVGWVAVVKEAVAMVVAAMAA